MALSDDLISQFAKISKSEKENKKESLVYGTVVEYNGSKYVRFDGSELLTPASLTTGIEIDDRVTVSIKNHAATVTGNITSPSVSKTELESCISDTVTKFDVIVAEKADITALTAETARIDSLQTENATIKEKLTASEADISELQTENATIKDTLTANKADITALQTETAEISGKLTAADADIESLQADNVVIRNALTSANADIGSLQADNVTIKEKLNTSEANISELQSNKLSATDAELKYANIDFSNIEMAAVKEFFTKSGIISDLIVGDQSVTGRLVGVTIVGDLIEGGTVKADKLVIKGNDGLYYKLNTNGETVEAEQTEYNSLNGSIITAKSITAEKINVHDLVAFGATIGGFKITNNSIYSGVKESANNTTRGIFLGGDGQIAFGDADNYIKYYKNTDGTYKLDISAKSISISSGSKTVEETIFDMQTEMDEIRDEVTTFLYINSSRGTVFKNDSISTILTVTVYRGSERITDMVALKSLMGDNVYLQWSFQRFDEDTAYIIDSSDPRISMDGFAFTVSADDVDAKAVFMCDLIEREET